MTLHKNPSIARNAAQQKHRKHDKAAEDVKGSFTPITCSADGVTQKTIRGGGQNKQHVTTKNTAKLDRETEELKHGKVSLDLGKVIQQGRQAKGWSQKDLATKVNEKPQVINDYEAGRGIPNQALISKIERTLGIKLRGKDMGQVLPPPGQ